MCFHLVGSNSLETTYILFELPYIGLVDFLVLVLELIGIISIQNRLMRGTSINKSQHKNPTSLAKANNNYFLCRLFPL